MRATALRPLPHLCGFTSDTASDNDHHLCGLLINAAETLPASGRSPGSGLLGRRILYCVMRPPSKSAHAVPRGTELVPMVWTNA